MRRRLEDAVAVWQAWRDQAAPLPRVRADVGAWLPGWLVRLVAALVTGATAGLGLWLAGAHGPALVAGLLGLAWTALAPSTASWAVCAAFLAVTRLATGTDHATGLAWALAVAGLAYAACRTTWWAAHVTPRGRVSRRALAGPARRDALVLLGAAALSGSVWWAARSPWTASTPVPALLLVVGTLAVALLGLLVARLLRRHAG